MSGTELVVTAVTALVGIAAGLTTIGRALTRVVVEIKRLIDAVKANTSETTKLANELRQHREQTNAEFARLDKRVAALEVVAWPGRS